MTLAMNLEKLIANADSCTYTVPNLTERINYEIQVDKRNMKKHTLNDLLRLYESKSH